MVGKNLGEVTVDLFGEVTTLPSGRRGRPAHRWSQNAENMVILGCAIGYSDNEIAKGLGISVPTLRKYYFSVLKQRDMQRMRLTLHRAEVLARSAMAGNVGADRQLQKMMEARDRYLAEERLKAAADGRDDIPVGKKEAARMKASKTIKTGGGFWGEDLKPGLTN